MTAPRLASLALVQAQAAFCIGQDLAGIAILGKTLKAIETYGNRIPEDVARKASWSGLRLKDKYGGVSRAD